MRGNKGEEITLAIASQIWRCIARLRNERNFFKNTLFLIFICIDDGSVDDMKQNTATTSNKRIILKLMKVTKTGEKRTQRRQRNNELEKQRWRRW